MKKKKVVYLIAIPYEGCLERVFAKREDAEREYGRGSYTEIIEVEVE